MMMMMMMMLEGAVADRPADASVAVATVLCGRGDER